MATITHNEAEYYLQKTHLDGIKYEQTVICRPRRELAANEKEEKTRRMITVFIIWLVPVADITYALID